MGWRNGMPVFGLGLLEAIPEADILALVDENDSNQDGISGRANYVFDAVKAQAGDLTRYRWDGLVGRPIHPVSEYSR